MRLLFSSLDYAPYFEEFLSFSLQEDSLFLLGLIRPIEIVADVSIEESSSL